MAPSECQLFAIDFAMHREHREKIVHRMRLKMDNQQLEASAILLHGGQEASRYDDDMAVLFRQESFFQYLFGVREPGCAGMIDLRTNQSVLFVPRLDDEWEIWCGKRPTREQIQERYLVDSVAYMDEMADVLAHQFAIRKLFVLHGVNTDSGLPTVTTSDFAGMKDHFDVDFDTLHNELVECRVIKTQKELELMRFINAQSSAAHVEVMQTLRVGHMEFQAESTFQYHCSTRCGARLMAYTCICGSGPNASTLHYGHAGAPNDKKLQDGEMILNDMGAELHCYASDITCTFPVNGKFTADQKTIYEGVLKAHDAVIEAIKPGVSYIDMHLLAHRELTTYFLEKGFFQNGTVDELMNQEISSYFFPCGLGHLMGLDVHDVGGYPLGGPKRSTTRTLKRLRLVRKLEPNMVLAVEPGWYFIDVLINELLANPQTTRFVNQQVLERFRASGGARVESNIVVTATGAENLTKVPRTVEEIERVMG